MGRTAEVTEAMKAWRFPRGIVGKILPAEGRRIAELAAGKDVLEIGTFCGLSTICMAQVARVIHAVDDFSCSGSSVKRVIDVLRWNLKRHRLLDKVVIHAGCYSQVLPVLKPASFDFAFVDDGHKEADVLRQIPECRRLLRPNAVIAFHDYKQSKIVGVKLAVDRALGPPEEIVGSTAVVRLAGA